jgi:hypothetical protein
MNIICRYVTKIKTKTEYQMGGSHVGEYGMYLPLICDGMYEGYPQFTGLVLPPVQQL